VTDQPFEQNTKYLQMSHPQSILFICKNLNFKLKIPGIFSVSFFFIWHFTDSAWLPFDAFDVVA
jgi:hypothetical protein